MSLLRYWGALVARAFSLCFCAALAFSTPAFASILSNGNFESGLTGWTAKGGGSLTLLTSGVYEGSNAAIMSNRTQVYQGPAKNILSALQASGKGSYEIKLRAKNATTTADIKPTIRLKTGGVNTYYAFGVSVGTSWTEVSGALELNWSGTLQEAEFYIAGTNATETFSVDAISVELGFARGTDWYVSPTGSDLNNGTSTSTPFQTIQKGVDSAQPGDVINLLAGTYKASDYDSVRSTLQSYLNTSYASIPTSIGAINPTNALVNISNSSGTASAYITLRAYPGAAVKLVFNGNYGISVFGSSYYVIEGLEIEGATLDISYSMADRNRTLRPRSSAFSGIGIQIRSSHHIIVRDCYVHHTPGSGIRSDNSDYLAFGDNIVSHATWWTPSGSSSMVVAANSSYDNYDGVKNWLRRNVVHSGWNTQIFSLRERDPNDTSYGGPMHSTIEDGQGLYTTRNNGTADIIGVSEGYPYGQFRIENNLVFNNGYGGLTYHKTNRGVIMNNTIVGNGVFPPNASRSGSNFNNSNDVDYFNNVIVYDHGNPSFVFQSSNINITNNLYIGPSTTQISGNTYLGSGALANNFIDPVITYGSPIGDSRMASVWGAGNLPSPAELFTYDFTPKAGGSAINSGTAVGGIFPDHDIDGYRRALTGLDRGAYDSDKSAFGNLIDARYLLRITPGAGYLRFDDFTRSGRATNLLSNNDFEVDATGWTAKGSCTVATNGTSPFFNNVSLRTSSRTQAFHGPQQNITAAALAAGPGTYRVSTYVRNTTTSSNATPTIEVTAGGSTSYFAIPAVSVGTDWMLVSGEVNVTWTGTPSAVKFYVANSATTETFTIDLPRVERLKRIEAESASLLGSASVGTDAGASGGSMVTGMGVNGNGIPIGLTQAAKKIRIGVTTAAHGTISVYKNGVHHTNIYQSPTSASFPGVVLSVNGIFLETGDTLRIQKDLYDSAYQIDYIDFEY
jgi:hypothetical protein